MDSGVGGAPRYASLRDYLRVLRKHRVLIVLITLVFGGAAFAASVRQTPRYAAEAAFSLSDPYQDLNLVSGEPVQPRQSSAERAAAATGSLLRRDQMIAVRRRMKTKLTPEVLRSLLSTKVEPVTAFVIVRAASSNPAFAARLADTTAKQAVDDAVYRQRIRLRALIRALQRRARNLDADDPADVLTLTTVEDRIARLQSLNAFSRAAELVRPATVPTVPVEPRPVRNTVLGLLLGLVIGLIAAFVRNSLDRHLRGARDIQEHLRLPLLGFVSHEAMGGVMTNGHRSLTDQDLESFRILRTNLDFLDIDHPVQMVIVTSALPEEGKSTVAASLACAQAAAGKTTLLVECDLRRPSLADRLGLDSGPGLAEYLTGRAVPQEILQTLTPPFASSSDGNGADPVEGRDLVCITAGGSTPRPAEMLGSERFREFLGQVRGAYDVVVLDTCPLLSVVDTLELVPYIDGVLFCVRAGHTTRDQAHAAKAALDHFPERPTGVVVTDIRRGEDEDYGFYSYAYAYEEIPRH